ncbi:GNAT family N-acetyltransferase [Streptomyces bohaiensis]|uniref:GNAT family N-acetyltransferase n=1 Tax=Streptomyces bohaiensis TaxID=1431344 RepID=A0ABX1CLI7_9ACTN|nr:GNAT family N-acetyltransferase [Streptomyces bohaiensis]NJQ17494.1 GNAT family N-acetyltransferase [Streptomyces bohaiensis]
MTSAVLRTTPTAELPADRLAAAHALFVSAFGPDTDPSDWEHCLGGVHATLDVDGELIGHAAVVERRLTHRGRPLRTGYVEGVAVAAGRRGRGHGAALLAAVERVVRERYELGALSSTADALSFYERLGWQRWRGTTAVLTPHGPRRTPEDDDALFVLPVSAPLEPHGELVCDHRAGDPW